MATITEQETPSCPDTDAGVRSEKQADVLRAAIDTYAPQITNDRDFALAAGFPRVDRDPRPISQIPDTELLAGFGE